MESRRGVSEQPRPSEICRAGPVASTSNAPNKRVWDRRNACTFCEQLVKKMARHLERRHHLEPEVGRILTRKKGSKERYEAFQVLRDQGNYKHNVKVQSGSKAGQLVPWRRATSGASEKGTEDFLVCGNCQAFFFRKTLWRHKVQCNKKWGKASRGGRVQSLARSMMPLTPGTSEGLKKVLDSMVVDDVSLLCKTDPLILKYGEKLYLKLGHETHQKHHISTKMRELGRLLKNLREHETKHGDQNARKTDLKDYLTPDRFCDVTMAVKRISSYGSLENRYRVPSLALKIGQSLVKCALIMKAENIQSGKDSFQIDKFLELYHLEWTDQVARGALATLKEKRWNNPPLIPLTRDIQKLQTYLDEEMSARRTELENRASASAHKAFAEVVLARLMLFNRRRQGEAGRMRIADFTARRAPNPDDDIVDSLSPLEKQLASSLTRVVIRGKKGRGVPVLLTMDLLSGIELLIQKRSAVGVCETNPYIFVNPMSAEQCALRGSDCLRKCVMNCGASAPDAITSTGLRRHIGTLSQVLNLKEHELDMLADFLGHDVRVHREFYRLPEATVQVAKISELLMTMEKGIGKWRGKTMDELDPGLEGAVSMGAVDVDADLDGRERDGDKCTGGKDAGGTPETPAPSRQTPPTVNNRRRSHRSWTVAEKAAIRRQLGTYIDHFEIPGKAACLRAIAAENALASRTWQAVKYCVYNTVRAAART